MALLAPLAACEGKRGPAATQSEVASSPPLRAKSLTGEYFDLADTRGKVVLVNIWATWCEPCKQELPELARLHRELGPQGFEVVAVSVDVERKESTVRRMAKQFDLPFTVLLDPQNQSVVDWKVVGYPTSFVLGRRGEPLWRRDGLIYENDEELGAVLRNALAEDPAQNPAANKTGGAP